jgi:hypothetical protein
MYSNVAIIIAVVAGTIVGGVTGYFLHKAKTDIDEMQKKIQGR